MFSIYFSQLAPDVTEALVVILCSAELRERVRRMSKHISTTPPSQQIYQKLIIPSFAWRAGALAKQKTIFGIWNDFSSRLLFHCEQQKWKPRQRNRKKTKTDLGTFHSRWRISIFWAKYKTTFAPIKAKSVMIRLFEIKPSDRRSLLLVRFQGRELEWCDGHH